MPFHDLNVPYNDNHAELSNTLAFHAELGYSVVAIGLSVTGKLPASLQTIPLPEITLPKNMTALTKLTLTVSDQSQNHRVASLQSHYDIITLRPTTEKALQLCCGSLECDLISFNLSQRLPFILKFKTVASALQRGIRFEIAYSPGITGGSDARRNLIGGATALIRATRGRGIILSSEARNALGLRGPFDVINLAHVWGLGQERGKEALCEEAGKVVRLASLKRTSFRGTVNVVGKAVEPAPQSAKQHQPSQPSATSVDSPSSGSMKRKASATSIHAGTTIPASTSTSTDDKPLSKREQKRRAKKAKFESRQPVAANETTLDTEGAATTNFPIKHESLPMTEKRKS